MRSGMIDCRTCANCTYIHEYEVYICGSSNGVDKLAHRIPFYNVTSIKDCPGYIEYKENDIYENDD